MPHKIVPVINQVLHMFELVMYWICMVPNMIQ